MRTLTDAFAPGTPPLPEGLRTLHVSPGRVVEPGMTVHANFTFRNLGGGTATGFRVRFRLPEGLTYLVGTARIDETPIDEEGGLTSLLQTSGAQIGDVPPGGERRVSLAYSVATTIENGTPISLQAAISSFEVPLIGSNVVRLVVRSRPVLQSAATRLSVTAVRELVPGAELQLRAQIHNSGQSSAHDVVALLPVPANTTYVPGSARIDGRAPESVSETEPFGLTHPTIVAPTLGPGATIDVGYRVSVDPVLADGTAIAATGSVCTQELAEFALAPVTLKIPSAPSFAGEDTSLRVECEDDVVPGQRVRCVVRARNGGTAVARGVRVRLALPEGLAYTAGSRTVDGAPAADREREQGVFELGDLEPGRSAEVGLSALVRSPIADGAELPIAARVHWSKGERVFERTLTVRSAPAFPPAFNAIVRETPRRVAPGDATAFTIHLQNMGTDAASDARLHLDADPELEQLRVTERDSELSLGDDGVVHLDTLEPNAPRTLKVEARVAATIEDQRQVRARATLQAAGLAPVDLGAALHVVASRPRFSAASSRVVAEKNEVLRPNRTTACRLTVHNEGTDRGRDVRVRFQLPEELRLESVEGASRDGDSVVFGEVAAQDTREATVHLRLVGTVGFGEVLEVAARVSGTNVVPLSLDPLQLATHAEPAFGEGATLTSLPSDAVDAGEEIAYALAVRNSGDGVAKRLSLRLDPPSNAVYAPGSTTVNDVPLLDFAGTSPLLAMSGLTLGDVGAGVEVIARLRMIVNTPLPADSYIETRAYVTWDEMPEMIVRAEPLRVRSTPALPIVDPLLPFSVIDAAAVPGYRNGAQRALAPAEEYIELPPATPVRGALPRDVTPGRNNVTLSLSKGEPQPNTVATPTALYLSLPEDRLEWIVQYLEEAGGGRLISHLMVIRALFPNTAEGPAANAALRRYVAVLDELVDRLFLKLRLPGVELTQDDFETRESRASLQALIEALRTERGREEPDEAGLRLTAFVEPAALSTAADELERAKLVTAAPWQVAATLLGTSLERDGTVIADFTPYRDALLQAFSPLAELSPTQLEAALREPSTVELETERDRVVRELAAQRNVPA